MSKPKKVNKERRYLAVSEALDSDLEQRLAEAVWGSDGRLCDCGQRSATDTLVVVTNTRNQSAYSGV